MQGGGGLESLPSRQFFFAADERFDRLQVTPVQQPLVPLAPESPLYRRLQALAQEIRHDQ